MFTPHGPHPPLSFLPAPRPSKTSPDLQYLLNLDGFSAAYRFATLLGTNSLVLKQQSSQAEWFYESVKPGVHYLPVLAANRTDILDRVAWAEGHQEEVKQMVERANRFALTYTTYYSRWGLGFLLGRVCRRVGQRLRGGGQGKVREGERTNRSDAERGAASCRGEEVRRQAGEEGRGGTISGMKVGLGCMERT